MIVAGINYHLVLEMSDVLDGVAHFGVIIEGRSSETRTLGFLQRGGVRDFGS